MTQMHKSNTSHFQSVGLLSFKEVVKFSNSEPQLGHLVWGLCSVTWWNLVNGQTQHMVQGFSFSAIEYDGDGWCSLELSRANDSLDLSLRRQNWMADEIKFSLYKTILFHLFQ